MDMFIYPRLGISSYAARDGGKLTGSEPRKARSDIADGTETPCLDLRIEVSLNSSVVALHQPHRYVLVQSTYWATLSSGRDQRSCDLRIPWRKSGTPRLRRATRIPKLPSFLFGQFESELRLESWPFAAKHPSRADAHRLGASLIRS